MMKGRLLLNLFQTTSIVKTPHFVPKFVQSTNKVQLRKQSNSHKQPFIPRAFCTTTNAAVDADQPNQEGSTIPSFMFQTDETSDSRVTKKDLQILNGEQIKLTKDNIGKFMVMDAKEIDTVIPEGLAGNILHELSILKMDKSVGYLIREKAIELINSLENAKNNSFVNTPVTLIDGRAGSGKSVILNQIVYWARKNGWLVVFLPSCYDFIGGGHITESRIYPGMYDQPGIGRVLCATLMRVHKEQLKAIPLKLDWSIKEFQRTPQSTLFDLLKFGAEKQEIAVEALVYFRKELSVVTEFPVLIAADGINSLFGNTHAFLDPVNTKLRPIPLSVDKLVLPQLFKNFRYPGLANGTMVSTVAYTPYSASTFVNSQNQKLFTQVNSFTKQEFGKVIDFYEQSGYISDELPTNSRDYIYYLSEGLGSHIAKYCVTL